MATIPCPSMLSFPGTITASLLVVWGRLDEDPRTSRSLVTSNTRRPRIWGRLPHQMEEPYAPMKKLLSLAVIGVFAVTACSSSAATQGPAASQAPAAGG